MPYDVFGWIMFSICMALSGVIIFYVVLIVRDHIKYGPPPPPKSTKHSSRMLPLIGVSPALYFAALKRDYDESGIDTDE